MERKIGEVFTYDNETFIVENSKFPDSCENCYFLKRDACTIKRKDYFGNCSSYTRTDRTDVIFKKLKENMETKELKVQIPEGYEIDKEKSTFENIVFKKINNRPKSWKEYIDKVHPSYSIDENGNPKFWCMPESFGDTRLFFTNRRLTEKIIAYAKLLALREDWVKERPFNKLKFIIAWNEFGVDVFSTELPEGRLIFPTKEMAEEFLNCFRDLIEKAKGLY